MEIVEVLYDYDFYSNILTSLLLPKNKILLNIFTGVILNSDACNMS